MRRGIVVLSLLIAPLFASASFAQGSSQRDKRDNDKQSGVQQQGQHDDAKCEKSQAAKPSGNQNQRGQRSDEDRRRDADNWRRHKGQDKGDNCSSQPPSPPPPPPPPSVGVAQIQGTVFSDVNGSGIVPGAPGLSGWTLTLSGPVTTTTTTNASGAYSFTALPVGTYLVCVVPAAGATETSPTSGAACPSGFGWSLDVPASIPDLWYTGIDFSLKP